MHHELPSGLTWKQEGKSIHLSNDFSGYTIHVPISEWILIAKQLVER
jgi:hypothetical protein